MRFGSKTSSQPRIGIEAQGIKQERERCQDGLGKFCSSKEMAEAVSAKPCSSEIPGLPDNQRKKAYFQASSRRIVLGHALTTRAIRCSM